MPVIHSSYRAPRGLRTGHASTVYPTLFRRVPAVAYQRTRLELIDGDFLDLDFLPRNSPDHKLAIISHGLESSSQAKYVRAMALHFSQNGWDTLAWNCRGCSGEPNRLLQSYHSGVSQDLSYVVDHALTLGYTEITLIGFSLGGNITLKYVGEAGANIAPQISSAIAFSVPCHLASSSITLGLPSNRLYMSRFITGLIEKVRQKAIQFPDQIDLTDIGSLRTFSQFDDRFTAPLNGFSSAEDYWEKAASLPHLSRVTIPTLLISALDDPFLPEACYPHDIAESSEQFHLETPETGGHVGFPGGTPYWSEKRALQFAQIKA